MTVRLATAVALVALALAALGACSDGASGASASGAAAPAAASAFFPGAPGDRWRYRAQGGSPRIAAVTAVDDGVIVMHGVGTPTTRYKASDREVVVVDLAGRPLYPLLRSPLREGAEWRYELAERDVRIPCRVRVGRDGADWTFRGTRFSGCVELVRECRYPRGAPFDRETRHTERETWCPSVGRVSSDSSFDPPPPRNFLPAFARERLAGLRVRGAPVVPALRRMSCDDVILVSSDVQAACGRQLDPVEPEGGRTEGDTCTYVWEQAGAAQMRVRVRRLAHSAARTDLDRALHAISAQQIPEDDPGVSGGRRLPSEPGIFAFAEGSHVVTIEAGSQACSASDAHRLAPLLQSLLR